MIINAGKTMVVTKAKINPLVKFKIDNNSI